MEKGKEIIDELAGMNSMLAGLPRTMPYSVPAGYFDNFRISVTNNMPESGKSLPYSVPQGYFEGFAAGIIAAINTEHAFQGLSKNMPLQVPSGYFEALPAQVLQAAKATERIKSRHISFRPFIKVAVAAMLVLGVGFGSYKIFFQQHASATEGILASVPGNEIEDYLQHTYRIDVGYVVSDDHVKNIQVDNKDIVRYLNETGWDTVD